MKSLSLTFTGILLLVACGGTAPTLSPGNVPNVDEATIAVLCDETDAASLADLADQVEALDGNADQTGIQAALSALRGQIAGLSLTGDAASARDAATGAIDRLNNAIDDPAARSDAADALRDLETSLCA